MKTNKILSIAALMIGLLCSWGGVHAQAPQSGSKGKPACAAANPEGFVQVIQAKEKANAQVQKDANGVAVPIGAISPSGTVNVQAVPADPSTPENKGTPVIQYGPDGVAIPIGAPAKTEQIKSDPTTPVNNK